MENALSKALSELLRRTRGATQKKVGAHAGISQPYVSDLKNGDRDGGVELWEKISEYFGMAYDDFYNFGKRIAGIESEIAINATTPTPTMTPQATNEPPAPPQRQKTDIEIQIDKDHEQLVGRFVDKKKALKINQLLVRLEELENGEGLKAALEWAEYRVHQAEKKLGLDQGSTGTEDK